jgi:DNA (cytosine-5)-methyltransferase 1
MLIEVSEHDQTPRFVQGLEEISPNEVVRKRECIFTNFNCDMLGTKQLNTHVPARIKTQQEIKDWLFHNGKLICRWIFIVELNKNGKSYGGEARRMYKREVAMFKNNEPLEHTATTPESNHCMPDSSKRKHSSLEVQPHTAKRPQLSPKCPVLTLGDAYCGAGGTSDGARQAGFKVIWGLKMIHLLWQHIVRIFPRLCTLKWMRRIFLAWRDAAFTAAIIFI